MAVAFRAKTVVGGTAANVTGTEPTGTALNDVELAWMVIATGYTAFTPPANWNLLFALAGTAADAKLYWIRRGASAPSYAFTYTGSKYRELSISSWSGCETAGTPFDVIVNNARTSRTPSNPDCPSIITSVPNTIVVALGMGWTGWSAAGGWTMPAGYTVVENDSTIAAGDLCIAYKAIAAANTTENPAAFGNAGAGANEVAEITLVLKPPQAGALQVGTTCFGGSSGMAA